MNHCHIDHRFAHPRVAFITPCSAADTRRTNQRFALRSNAWAKPRNLLSSLLDSPSPAPSPKGSRHNGASACRHSGYPPKSSSNVESVPWPGPAPLRNHPHLGYWPHAPRRRSPCPRHRPGGALAAADFLAAIVAAFGTALRSLDRLAVEDG